MSGLYSFGYSVIMYTSPAPKGVALSTLRGDSKSTIVMTSAPDLFDTWLARWVFPTLCLVVTASVIITSFFVLDYGAGGLS